MKKEKRGKFLYVGISIIILYFVIVIYLIRSFSGGESITTATVVKDKDTYYAEYNTLEGKERTPISNIKLCNKFKNNRNYKEGDIIEIYLGDDIDGKVDKVTLLVSTYGVLLFILLFISSSFIKLRRKVKVK